jgi:serine/threonine-protein kinase RsbW
MTEPLELRGEASMATIAQFVTRVAEACSRCGADEETCYAVRLAVEEVCLNVLQHGYGGEPGPLDVRLDPGTDRFTVTITDAARPFSPDDAPPADVDSDWESRRIGGLGWHLVHSMMDGVEHEIAPGGGNRVTLTKRRAPAQ